MWSLRGFVLAKLEGRLCEAYASKDPKMLTASSLSTPILSSQNRKP